ncbi:hypothetical protein ONZ51_g7620 [Trametes cubensis]|uniref:BTB domain-containing protein n=1 Tax=Trametes cubensis TaxID=1111947 RepID=A0AAD7TS97_9APHY|nr:hypothetical protein ONZ51_g7620 [Trametes cubensis]
MSSLQRQNGQPQARAPFNHSTADLILRASDDVAFYVRTGILAESSPVFYDMFALSTKVSVAADPSEAKAASDTTPSSPASSPTVLEVPENSDTLDALLRICYPIPNPTFHESNALKPVLAAAHKYQMEIVLATLGTRLTEFAQDMPLRVYAIAIRYDMDTLARSAACLFLRHHWDPAGGRFAELDDISGSAYHCLLAYRRKCADTLANMCSGLGWLPDSRWTFMQCDDCKREPLTPSFQLGDSDVKKKPVNWFWQYYQRIAIRLQDTPCEEALDDVLLVTQPVRVAVNCGTCRSTSFEHMLRFVLEMKREVNRRVSEVALEIL